MARGVSTTNEGTPDQPVSEKHIISVELAETDFVWPRRTVAFVNVGCQFWKILPPNKR